MISLVVAAVVATLAVIALLIAAAWLVATRFAHKLPQGLQDGLGKMHDKMRN